MLLMSDIDTINTQLARAVWVTDLMPADIVRALRTARALRDAHSATTQRGVDAELEARYSEVR